MLPGHGRPFAEPARRIEAISRSKLRRTEAIRRLIEEQPSTLTEIADQLVVTAVLGFRRGRSLTGTAAFRRAEGAVVQAPGRRYGRPAGGAR